MKMVVAVILSLWESAPRCALLEPIALTAVLEPMLIRIPVPVHRDWDQWNGNQSSFWDMCVSRMLECCRDIALWDI